MTQIGFMILSSARWLATILLPAFTLCAWDTALAERAVTLAWSPSPGESVAGYYVYAWEENAETPIRVDAGNNSTAIVRGLKEGLRYVFQVSAYNGSGLESPPSEGLPYRVPVPIKMLPSSDGSSASRVRFPASPGRWYELQASTDLTNWATIWQTGVVNSYSWMEYQDPRSRYYKSRFYRLVVH